MILGKKNQLALVIHQAMTDKVKVSGKMQGLTGFTLVCIDGVGSRKEVITQQIMPGSGDPVEIADVVEGRAETFASGSDSKVKFELGFFYGTEKALRPYTFHVLPEVADGAFGAEEASAKGIIKSVTGPLARLFQMNFEQINANGAAAVEMMSAMTAAMRTTNEQLRLVTEERNVIEDQLVRMKYAADDRSHLHRMEELEKQKKNEMFRNVMQYLPALVNQFTKKNVFPESTGDSALLKGLLASMANLDKETVLGLLSQLPQEVAGPLMSRAMQLKEEDDKRKAELAKALEEAKGIIKAPELPVETKEG